MNAQPNRITGISGILPDSRLDARYLAVRVLDLTRDLVGLVAQCDWTRVSRVVLERRRLIDRLPEQAADGNHEGAILALRSAMDESDRTVGLLLANAELRWPGGCRDGLGTGPRIGK
jgi:hypothetical protein